MEVIEAYTTKPPNMSWRDYLRGSEYVEFPEYEKKVEERRVLTRPYYRRLLPGMDKTKLERRRNPIGIPAHYGAYSFRVICLQTGKKPQVPFIKYEEYGLDAVRGTSERYIFADYHIKRAAIQKFCDEKKAEFWKAYHKIGDELYALRPKYIVESITFEERQRRYREEYLHSDQWEKIRRMIWHRDDGCCVACGNSGRIYQVDVHHDTYARIGDENLEDLRLLCRRCHQKEHGR